MVSKNLRKTQLGGKDIKQDIETVPASKEKVATSIKEEVVASPANREGVDSDRIEQETSNDMQSHEHQSKSADSVHKFNDAGSQTQEQDSGIEEDVLTVEPDLESGTKDKKLEILSVLL